MLSIVLTRRYQTFLTWKPFNYQEPLKHIEAMHRAQQSLLINHPTGVEMNINAIEVSLISNCKRINKTVAVIENPFGRVIGREVALCLPNQATFNINIYDAKRFFKTHARTKAGAVKWTIEATQEALREAYTGLRRLIESGGDAAIPVSRVGDGPTSLSSRIRIKGVVHPIDTGEAEKEVKTHTITVPASAIFNLDGQLYVKRWQLRRFLHERVFKANAWPEDIENGCWLSANTFWEEFFSPLMAEAEKIEKEEMESEKANRKAQKRWVWDKPKREQERAKERELQAQREAKLKADKERRAEQNQRHMDSLETIFAPHVKWIDTVTRKNKYGSKTWERVTRSAENCTLKFSGKRVYIILPNGHEIIKHVRNVEWSDH